MNQEAYGNKNTGMAKQGFTLIEILAVIAIIGLLAAVIVPNLGKRSPLNERKATLAKLNGLVQLAWKNALVTNKLHKIVIDLIKNKISVEIATGDYRQGKPESKPLERTYINTEMKWPENLEVKQLFIEGIDEIGLRGKTELALYFFVMPDGLAQDVIINFIDTKDLRPDGQPKQFGLVLNPFNAQFTVYDTFQK